MRVVIQRYEADRNQLGRFYPTASSARFARLKRFDLDWAAALDGLRAGALGAAAKKDLQTLKNTIKANLKQVDADAAAATSLTPLLPFAAQIAQLEEARMRMDTRDAEKSAEVLSQALDAIGKTRAALAAALAESDKLNAMIPGKDQVAAAADGTGQLRTALRDWFNFYNDYDPLFTWWMAEPYKPMDKALEDYAAFLRDKIAPAIRRGKSPAAPPVQVDPAPAPRFAEVPDLRALLSFPQDEMRGVVQQFRRGSGRGFGGRGGAGGGNAAPGKKYFMDWLVALGKLNFNKLSRDGQIDYLYLRNSIGVQIRRAGSQPPAAVPSKPDASGIAGRPIGREALMLSLAEELIPYTPEQLIALADRQFAWCESEMKKASRELGCGDDWKAAIEKVKDMHVAPGKQPDAVRDLMLQAVDYLRANDLITVPEIEAETLHMEMMSPEMQRYLPFFSGGEDITVAYPAVSMTTGQKIESMRGNNVPFSHATAFHEMIPGHNMQDFMSRRYGSFLGNLSTSFWIEGWAVYWEMLLYDMGFDRTPEERIGALFWRMHRCARIVFSLKFHLGEWSPQECIDYLVAKVGHERENATAEVRRSFAGGYGPLYQAGYLIGALQIRELHKEFLDSGEMTSKQFHDAVIERGGMPIALLRLALGKQKLTRDMTLEWKCFGPDPGKQ
jgi:uncharacterized protein (DUF885 family)